jgi:hypothetical protein
MLNQQHFIQQTPSSSEPREDGWLEVWTWSVPLNTTQSIECMASFTSDEAGHQ